MGFRVDLNSDLGESFGVYTIGNDENVLSYITSANIACGYHAGDHNVMHRTVKTANKNKVGLGAHPGLPDLMGFGRREMRVEPMDVYNLVVYQIGALMAFAAVYGQTLQHVKPHGALYNMASRNKEIAEAIAEAITDTVPESILFGLAGGELISAGKKKELNVAQEVFADRTYQPDGTLTPREMPNALIYDADLAVTRVIRMVKERKVETVNGSDIDIQADTVCVHGDSPNAIAFAKKLRCELALRQIEVKRVGL